MPRSLAARLMLSAMAGVLSAMLVALVPFYLLLWPSPSPRILQMKVAGEVDDIDRDLRIDASGNGTLASGDDNDDYDAMPKDTAYLVTDAAGRIVLQSQDGPALEALRQAPGGAASTQIPNGDSTIVLQIAERSVVHEGKRYAIRAARSDRLVAGLTEFAGRIYMRAGAIAAIVALSTFAVIVFLTNRRLVRPLQRASDIASHISPRNLSARLQVEGLPSELQPLIDALNGALSRLEKGFRVQQEFLATAAHELKTPLALLQAEVELGTPDREVLLRDIALMARQVNQLLHLAEASEDHNYRFSRVSLREVAEDAVRYLSRMADQRGVRLLLDTASGEPAVEADRGAVFMLLKNLLENAVQHSFQGGAVVLALHRHGFDVSDEGRGIPEADRAYLFERFWRGAQAQAGEGVGLGLAICREICLAHGWQIRVGPSGEGAGACFQVDIPNTEETR
jgi:signal transduction histidine kinase